MDDGKKVEHTPTPWDHDDKGTLFVVEPQCCGHPIQEANYDGGGNPTSIAYEECCGSPDAIQVQVAQASPADAAFIKHAVNSHDEMRAALEAIAEPIDFTTCIGNPWDFYRDLQNIARTALSKATNHD